MKKALAFDDVLLTPKYSTIRSRDDVDISTSLGKHTFRIPIMSANMATVSGEQMVRTMAELGGLGVLDRTNNNPNDVLAIIQRTCVDGLVLAVSVGVGESAYTEAGGYYRAGCPIVCVDVAHGHHERVVSLVTKLLSEYAELTVVAGNIATKEAYQTFAKVLSDEQQERLVLKVGVGSGSLCSTRVVTGFGLPTLESLLRIVEAQDGIQLIADGGIKNSGDIVKSLAAGADAVMLGSLLAGTDEAPGSIIKDDRTQLKYKVYRGSASFGTKTESSGDPKYIEGAEMLIPYKGSAASVIRKLVEGIKSGFSYNGSHTLFELQAHAQFVEITSAGSYESRPHNLLP